MWLIFEYCFRMRCQLLHGLLYDYRNLSLHFEGMCQEYFLPIKIKIIIRFTAILFVNALFVLVFSWGLLASSLGLWNLVKNDVFNSFEVLCWTACFIPCLQYEILIENYVSIKYLIIHINYIKWFQK